MTTQEFNKSIESLGDSYEAAKDAVHQSMNPAGSEMSTVLNALGQFRDLAATALQKIQHNNIRFPSDGVVHIAIERAEQINSLGRTVELDVKNNDGQQLAQAASVLSYPFHYAQDNDDIPEGWDRDLFLKMWNKPMKERLIIAGALIAAEIDRLNFVEKS